MDITKILSSSHIEYRENEPMSRHTTFKIGGAAKYYIIPKNREELVSAIGNCKAAGIRYFVLGRGSNVLFDDNGYDGAVITTEKLNSISVSDNVITAECGASVTQLSVASRDASLSGLEFAYGIPGFVGGAVFMNAGAYGGEIADVLLKSTYYDTVSGEYRTLCGTEHNFGYRTSFYKEHPESVILTAQFGLNASDKTAVKELMDKNMEARRTKQPLEYPSAGSVFKRAPGHYTGQMIEELGLKGHRIGDAMVSEKHAGFIINAGNAKANDVKSLVEVIKERVLKEYGVSLECELIYVK